MKSSLLSITKIAFAIILCITLSSCPDDDVISVDNLLEILQKNKWVGHDTWVGETVSGHAWVDLETTTLYFTSESSGMLYMVVKDYDTDLGNTTSKSWTLFNYSVSGSSVYITFETNDRMTLTYDGDYLVNGQYDSMYKKTALSSGDYEIINKNKPQEDKCGASLNYKFDSRTGVLEISGTGKMNNYTTSNQPWKSWNVKKVVVKEGCTYIGENAFKNMICITDIDLANSIEEIGAFAFDNLTITSVDLPTKLKLIGKAAFGDCNYLKDVSFYGCDQLERIEGQAFSGSPLSLSYFTLPPNVTTVGEYAFYSAKFTSLTLNDKLETVGKHAFHNISSKKLELPNSVKSVGLSAFQGSINEIVIGTGLRKIEKCAFNGSASGKISVNLGVPLTDVDQGIICNPSGEIADSKWTLVVPVGSKSAYQKADVWKNFKSITESSSLVSGNGTPSGNGNGNGDNPNGNDDYKPYTGNGEFNVNGVEFKMIKVGGGSFTMGATSEQGWDYEDRERPTHNVSLNSFYIGETEVTQALWVAVMGSNPSHFTSDRLRPVEQVTWDDCQTFINKLSALTGVKFRLPTEAEWEYAARGGTQSKGYMYAGSNNIDEVAWYWTDSTHPVKSKQPNELGLYDMSGNVVEWCNDWYGAYSDEAQTNPKGPDTGQYRIQRGGQYGVKANRCRVAYRSYGIPTGKSIDRGLRLAI